MRAFKVAGMMMLSALLIGSVGCQGGGGDIKVAVLAPLSGPAPTFGISTRDGALMAISEWNAKGGVPARRSCRS